MNFNPIFIEEFLTIDKYELEELKQFGFYPHFVNINNINKNEYIHSFQIETEFLYCKMNDNLKMDLSFRFVPNECNFGVNATYSVQSANHSVKYQRAYTELEKGFKLQRWTADLCTLTDALNPKKNFLVNGELKVHLKAMVYNKPSEGEEKSCTNLEKFLWNRNDDRDFVIVVGAKDGPKTDVKIHKCVLASRSPVFDRMLETDMKEKAQNRLEIIDFNVEVVQAAVEYFYGRNTFKSLNVENLIGLLFFADKYLIADLKDELAPLFLIHIYPDTIVKIANASVMTNIFALQKMCVTSLNLYLNQNVLFNDAETLDEEIKKELIYDSVRREFYSD